MSAVSGRVDCVDGRNIPAAKIAGRLVPRPSADDVAFIIEASVVRAAARNPLDGRAIRVHTSAISTRYLTGGFG